MSHQNPSSRCLGALLCLLLALGLAPTPARAADVDFSADYERVLQIRVASRDAGGKSAIGSGFRVAGDGLVVTNYHVVSAHVLAPERHRIRYATHDGRTGELELLDFDVVADLALLRTPDLGGGHFELADGLPALGETVYALGNPGDWGIVMVPGPANGLVEHSHERRVLFSGSLNSGMSGGPALNGAGEVVGVNVATAGSQLSFLVPAERVERLVARERRPHPDAYDAELAEQVRLWQRDRLDGLARDPWPVEAFAGRELFGEIRSDFRCWGHTNASSEERTIALVRRSCESGDDVYVGPGLDLGQVRFSFASLRPEKLNPMQFARAQSLYMSADNRSDHEHSTGYECRTDFVEDPEGSSDGYLRVITCVRAYKRLVGLHDSLLLAFRHTGDEVFKAYLSLSGVEGDQVRTLNRRFLERAL